jgi:hypothetical protein
MEHTITPPPELVQQWADMLSHRSDHAVFSLAARWGADHELEACCELMDDWGLDEADLRAARRPKPPSLKEQALADLHEIYIEQPFPVGDSRFNRIRRAIEALPND